MTYNLSNTVNEVLSDFLPQHLVKLITPKLVMAIERIYGGSDNNANGNGVPVLQKRQLFDVSL